jgi:hypothetical protein
MGSRLSGFAIRLCGKKIQSPQKGEAVLGPDDAQGCTDESMGLQHS